MAPHRGGRTGESTHPLLLQSAEETWGRRSVPSSRQRAASGRKRCFGGATARVHSVEGSSFGDRGRHCFDGRAARRWVGSMAASVVGRSALGRTEGVGPSYAERRTARSSRAPVEWIDAPDWKHDVGQPEAARHCVRIRTASAIPRAALHRMHPAVESEAAIHPVDSCTALGRTTHCPGSYPETPTVRSIMPHHGKHLGFGHETRCPRSEDEVSTAGRSASLRGERLHFQPLRRCPMARSSTLSGRMHCEDRSGGRRGDSNQRRTPSP